MNWDECVEESKEELGITGWTNDWDEVIQLAKEKYWSGENFKELKEKTINVSGGKCKLCSSEDGLTAHHIFYGKNEKTICLCKWCHEIIHKKCDSYGFVLQLVLLYWDNLKKLFEKYPNLGNVCYRCINKINKEIKENKK